jgi:hypothetical protein
LDVSSHAPLLPDEVAVPKLKLSNSTTAAALHRKVRSRFNVAEGEVRAILRQLENLDLVIREGEHYLSLAVRRDRSYI